MLNGLLRKEIHTWVYIRVIQTTLTSHAVFYCFTNKALHWIGCFTLLTIITITAITLAVPLNIYMAQHSGKIFHTHSVRIGYTQHTTPCAASFFSRACYSLLLSMALRLFRSPSLRLSLPLVRRLYLLLGVARGARHLCILHLVQSPSRHLSLQLFGRWLRWRSSGRQ